MVPPRCVAAALWGEGDHADCFWAAAAGTSVGATSKAVAVP
jgi:hypothetical protein